MTRLVLDQGLPQRTAQDLHHAGMDVVHVGELGMHRDTDAEIMELARREGRAVVTLDIDFGELLARSGATQPSVIYLRRVGWEPSIEVDDYLDDSVGFSYSARTGDLLVEE